MLKIIIEYNKMKDPAKPIQELDASSSKQIVRTPIVLLCAVALGLTLNLIAETNGRPAPLPGDVITSPAQTDAPFA
jgi:hypothetical protein